MYSAIFLLLNFCQIFLFGPSNINRLFFARRTVILLCKMEYFQYFLETRRNFPTVIICKRTCCTNQDGKRDTSENYKYGKYGVASENCQTKM